MIATNRLCECAREEPLGNTTHDWKMTPDEIEFLISQHFDQTLTADESASLRAVLSADPKARAIFEQYARIDRALHDSRVQPEVDTEFVVAEIAGQLDELETPAPASLPMPWLFRMAPMAVAAVLLIGLGLGIAFLRDGGEKIPRNGPGVAVVSLPQARPAKASAGPAVEPTLTVSIGQPISITPQMLTALFLAQPRPARVEIRPVGQRADGSFD